VSQPQTVLPFKVQVVPQNDSVTGRAGLPLVVEALRAFGMDEVIKSKLQVHERAGGFPETELLEAIVLLLASGGDCVADINVLAADHGLCRLLNRTLPSSDALFDFLYAFHSDELIENAKAERKPDQKAYIPKENAALGALGSVNEELVRRVATRRRATVATLDHDATIQECHKREALAHYKGGRGYQPSAMVWAELGLALVDEYRDGNVPAGMSNLPLIKRGFAALPAGVEQRFFRADSACYEEPVLKWLAHRDRAAEPGGPIGFAISADMTPELHEVCKAVPEAEWGLFEERVDETVSWAEVELTPGDWPKDATPLRYVALRIRKRQGELFANGSDTRHLAVVANLSGTKNGEAVVRWHRQKAGTIELMHDVSKNELGAGVPPSGKFGANAAWYRLSLMTLNVLTGLKLHALPKAMEKARPKRLRFSVFQIAGRIVSHADQLIVRVGEEAERIAGLLVARARLAELRPLFAAT